MNRKHRQAELAYFRELAPLAHLTPEEREALAAEMIAQSTVLSGFVAQRREPTGERPARTLHRPSWMPEEGH